MAARARMTAAGRWHELLALFALAAVVSDAVACPPPPPPQPTVAQQAQAFWERVDNVCLVRIDGAAVSPSDLPFLKLLPIADGRWQVPVAPLGRWKGDCTSTTVHFAEISPALCGGGMPAFDTLLVAGWGADRVMTVWTAADSDLAQALRALARRAPAQGSRL